MLTTTPPCSPLNKYIIGQNKKETLEYSEESLESLTDYIDECFDRIVMGKTNQTPSASSKASTSKRSRNEESPGATSPAGNNSTDILTSSDKKLSSFDARMSLLEIIHRQFQALRELLEFSQQQVQMLAAENAALRGSVKSLNKRIKESIIDLQACSMRDNLVFSGIPEQADEDPELTVKNFIQNQLKLPGDALFTESTAWEGKDPMPADRDRLWPSLNTTNRKLR